MVWGIEPKMRLKGIVTGNFILDGLILEPAGTSIFRD
jgi:hypothetical protein